MHFLYPFKDTGQCHRTINQLAFKGVPWPFQGSISPLRKCSQKPPRQNLHSGMGEGNIESLEVTDTNYHI